MNEIQYIGEHLLPGQIGRLTIVLGFVASFLAAVAYFFAEQKKETAEAHGWLKIGRWSYIIHGLSVFVTIGCMFFVMYHRMYEYQYAQAHVSDDLEMRYILSAFWEGQEGSFLLWMFWHVILGWILIRVSKSWEAPVMAPLALIQFFIGSMILGVYIGELKIGANPLLLLRDVMDLPVFAQADYAALLNGNGLNPLLQNYWMTIHPPTLFLGFASTAVPFCFAIAGLWTGRHRDMLQVSFPWALFSASILGIGILMGGAWAYEALTFGGYWAWDPVENASLVPWLILVAGIHTHLVAKTTGYSIKSTYLFYLLTFFFIIYSTFLTRSGILGDTSVHAFTEMGLENQLLIFTLFFLIFPLTVFFLKGKTIPVIAKEEATGSKEFWMFIGALVLLFSAGLITASTSLPVYNKIRELFDPAFEGFVIQDQVAHHNKYQLWIGVFVGLLSGGTQYLRFKEPNFSNHTKKFLTHLGIAGIISLGLTFLMGQWIQVRAWQYQLLLFTGIFSVITNLDYLVSFAKGNLKLAGSIISHVGFGLMIVGILASGLNKEFISTDPFTQRGLLNDEMLKENVILFKNRPANMNGYQITYKQDTLVDRLRHYDINFKKLTKNGQVAEDFTVRPTAQFDNQLTKVAAYNPDTQHYLDKDIFTLIRTLPLKEADVNERKRLEDSLNFRIIEFPIGAIGSFTDSLQTEDSLFISTFDVTIEELIRNASHPDYDPKPKDIAMGLKMKIQERGKPEVYDATPVILLRNNLVFAYPIQINDLAIKIKLPSEFLNKIFETEIELDFKKFLMQKGQSINYNGYQITLDNIDLVDPLSQNTTNKNYFAQKGDVAARAKISVRKNGLPVPQVVEPIFLIRGNQPFPINDKLISEGLHFQFSNINRETGKMTINIAQTDTDVNYPIEIATNSLRTDYIVFSAIIFPGINFLWTGTIMMMLGLAFSWIRRRQELYRSK